MRRRTLRLALGAAAVAVLLAAFGTASASAQQVTGLQAVQRDGYTTVTWTTVAGATDYQIERTPVDAANLPTGASEIVGLWRPNRTITPESPSFADAGYNPGDRFQWRVRARFGTTAQPFSDPVFDTTIPEWGDPAVSGESLRTQWEDTNAA